MATTPFQNKRILLGVTGSVAAYKAADLASKLTQAGAAVDVILTEAATKFVAPLTFSSLTGRPAHSSLWAADNSHVLHVNLAETADLFVIAPATADAIAKLANGLADDLLTVSVLAARCPIVVVPAMDGGMFASPATQENVETLKRRGVTLVGPVEGRMASGLTGLGRMVDITELVGELRLVLSCKGPLAGKTVVVSAGGTQEAIDPVRFISNHSSGKQGFAVAQAALDRGATVYLISGPNALPTPHGAHRINVRSAAEMAQAVLEKSETADVLVMAAAVADFRPAEEAQQKIKRGGLDGYALQLTKTVDILLAVRDLRERTQRPSVVVGFAAETQNVLENAMDKVRRKRLDMIVANDVSATDAGFNTDTNRVVIITADGRQEALPLATKYEVGVGVCERFETILSDRSAK